MNVHGSRIHVFSLTANRLLSKQIAENLKLPVGKAVVSTFSDGETSITLDESVRGADVFLIQSTCAPVNDHLMELLLLIDAAKRASAGRITAVIPNFGYARQDRRARPRDPISARLVADLLTAAGADRILTMDLHAPQIEGFFGIPVDHLTGAPLLARYFHQYQAEHPGDYVVVAPDLGAVTRARDFAARLDCPLAVVDKRRQQANVCEVVNIVGDVKDKYVLMVDDMIDTAGTLCNAAEALVQKGGARQVMAAATHAVLSGPAVERLRNSPIDQVVLLDTIALPPEKRLNKFTVLPSAPVFAEAIRRIAADQSVWALFE